MAKNSVQEIAAVIAGKHGLSQQDAEAFVYSFFNLINDGLHSEKVVKVKGLGTFKVIDVRERESVNVNTGERVLIESHGKITFTADPIMRDLVNKPFAQFETVVLNDGVELEDMAKVKTSDDADLKDEIIDEVDSDNVNDDADEFISQENKTESVDINESCDLPQSGQGMKDSQISICDDNSDERPVSAHIESIDRCVDDVDDGNDYSRQETNHVTNDNIVNNSVSDDLIPENIHSVRLTACDDYANESDLQEDGLSSDNEMADDVQTGQAENSEAERFTSKTIEQFVAGRIDETSDGSDEESNFKVSGMAWYYWILIMLVVAIFSFWGGCCWEKYNANPTIKYVTVKQSAMPVNAGIVDTVADNDSVMTDDNRLKQKADDSINVKNNTTGKSEVQDDAPVLASSTVAGKQELRNAAIAVRTGAYRIVGTDCVVTVKKGETLKKISKFYLGEGMECYIMVHNGITDIKEGMRLKIPKVVNKKKK